MAELSGDFPFLTELERYESFLLLYRSTRAEDQRALERLCASPDPLIPLILLQYLEELPERPALAAVLKLLESGNEIVSRAAMKAYTRNHFPGKARLLKQLIFSPSSRACRFAVRTLSRAGFAEILPLLLRELPERQGPVQAEMIDALRFLPDRRSLPVLRPLLKSPDPSLRLRALQAVVELQSRGRALPLRSYLALAQDESESVRRCALEALERFPGRQVAPLILEAALDESKPDDARARALRALARFPSADWARPVNEIAARSRVPAVRIAAEVALRALPEKELRRGLLPLLDDPQPEVRRQAARFAADLLGQEPDVRGRIHALWRAADSEGAVELIDALRALAGPDTAALLGEGVRGDPIAAYAAATALAELRGPHAGPIIVDLLESSGFSELVRQQLMSRWVKREPEEKIKDRLFVLASAALGSKTANLRYMGAHALAWFPMSRTLRPLLDLLSRESEPDLARAVLRQISRGLGADPLPLFEAVGAHPRASALLGHAVRLLTSQSWDHSRTGPLLETLARPPLSLLDSRPETYFAAAVHLVEQGALEFETLWDSVPDPGRRRMLLEILASFVAERRRRFPALPFAWMAPRLREEGAATRRAFYALLLADGSAEAVETIAAELLREEDRALAEKTAAGLRALLMQSP